MHQPSVYAAFGAAIAVVICATILAATGSVIPDWFPVLAGAFVGGGAGVAVSPKG